jgi:SAM-dependent methyltransferase
MSVMKVDEERWQQAQEAEFKVWRREERSFGTWGAFKRLIKKLLGRQIHQPGDDWNYWWKEKFDHYRFLPKDLGHVIELGCGPYTNARLVTEGRTYQRLVLSDPNALRYAAFEHGWLAEQYRACKVILDDSPIEKLPFADAQFDMVILNNVLDHVQDAGLCMRNAARILKPGGWFLFGQDLTNDEDEGKHDHGHEDLCHPIHFDLESIEPFLVPFEQVHRIALSREQGRAPEAHYATLIFAGRKKG